MNNVQKYNSLELEFLKENILDKGFSLVIGLNDCDLILAKEIKNNKENNFEIELFNSLNVIYNKIFFSNFNNL